jgi:ribosomal protein S18 acetylase RimI-like enzyme
VPSDGIIIPASIRSFESKDQTACRKLYEGGLLGGGIAENDTGYDMDHIHAVYMKCPGSHFWVAESATDQIVGMIGVQHHDDGKGQIRRLRVRNDCQRRGIGTLLLETALRFCQEKNYLKVTLDTFVERDAAVSLFEKFRFRLDHTRSIGQKELAYFYLDLYAGDGRRPDVVLETGGEQQRPAIPD